MVHAAEAKPLTTDKYTIQIPNGCKVEKKENRFTHTDANIECSGGGDTAFHLESSDTLSSEGYTKDEIVDKLRTTFGDLYDNTNVIESGYDKYTVNNQSIPYIIGSYDQEFHNGFGMPIEPKPYAAMIAWIELGKGNSMLFQYVNTQEDFDSGLPKAVKMMQSIKPSPNLKENNGTSEDNTYTGTDTNTGGQYSSDKYPNLAEACNQGNSAIYTKNLCDLLLGKTPAQEYMNPTQAIENPEVSPEQDKPYKDCLADTSKTYIDCQQFNPRN
jgi:hypothetical protein